MELSIIIPVYNVERTLRRCVKSVLGQTYGDDELILINDGSTDGSATICDDLAQEDSRIYVIHQANGGLCAARNAGLDRMRGTFVTFLDADDYLGTDTLQQVMDAVRAHSTCHIIEYPIYVHYGKARQRLLNFANREFHDINRYWITHRGYLHSYVCNKVFRAELFRDTRFPAGQVFEDVITTARLLSLSQNIATIDQGLYYYTENSDGITANAGVKELSQLLTAHLDAMRQYIHTDGIGAKDLAAYYLHLVNIHIDLHRGGKNDISLPHIHIPFGLFTDKDIPMRTKLKALIIKIIGEKALCRLYPRRR